MDPMTHLQQNPLYQWWSSALEGQVRNLTAMTAELSRMEEKSMEHAQHAVDETARLTKEALSAATQMHAAWRKVALEVTTRSSS
ncbi:MAG: hypothetical protein CMN30_25560 [Sandaracinus sp.]|nr:hypothetical protein [Sandaracinus sp.]|tara:strand:- start:4719 stop:4970 length:252 start_codon:yes stop_codon:yes gene_type:complete